MARVLILCRGYPTAISSGEFLRTHNFCRELAERYESYLVYLDETDTEHDPEQDLGVRAWRRLATISAQDRSWRRLFRYSNAKFLELSAPEYLEETRKKIQGLCEMWNIDVIVCFAPGAAEIIAPINLPKILDYCDSVTLTLERVLAHRGKDFSLLEWANLHLRKFRQGSLERTFVRAFDCTTTISEADKRSFVDVAQVPHEKVSVIPNGVADEALNAGQRAREHRRSVVFWGNLDFPPNWTAVEYFFHNIYQPYLAQEDIEWHIYGRGASQSIEQIARHEGVFLHGYVDDLFSEVAKQGVMINPMVEGSGLKNKVLEAFACKVPVVSTSLGIEAIDASPDLHYVRADAPEEFAKAICSLLADKGYASRIAEDARLLVESRFRWSVIGEQLGSLVDRILSCKSNGGVGAA
jgi:glycosyltransferase involved in cell wall biosynthesis